MLIAGWTHPAGADRAIVRAVLFFSPTCSHCHKVMTEDLPPLIEQYGDQLRIFEIDVSQPDGAHLYQAAVQRFNIPRQRMKVPMLIVGRVVLVGSVEIPDRFPALVERSLASGGVEWPDVPGLHEAVPPEPAEAAQSAIGLIVAVLVGLAGAALVTFVRLRRTPRRAA